MTAQELEIVLTERCNALDLTKIAFGYLEEILKDNASGKDFLGGFEPNEINAIFDRYEYQIERRYGEAIIRTRIGLYCMDVDSIWLESIRPIGYYALDTNFKGEVIDDWFVIEKEKHLKGI